MIKKLTTLIVLLLIAFTTFSQTVINKDSVKISLQTSKAIIKDLYMGDECLANQKILTSQLGLKEDMLTQKDNQIGWYQQQAANKDKEIVIYQSDYKKLAKQYKILKVKDRLKMGGAVVVVTGLGYMFIKK